MKSKIVAGLLFATALISFAAWSRWSNDKSDKPAEALPLAVKIQVLAPAEIAQTLTVSGTLVGENEATVISETNGTVVAVRAQVGDWLKQGQTIVQIENDLKLVALEQAKAQLLTAQTNHDKAKKDLERYEELFKQQITTQSVIESARLAERAAEAQLKSAEAALKLAQRQYDDSFIKAPLAGRLADRYVNQAAMVMPGDKIGVIVDGRQMKLKTSVTESEIALLRSGQTAEVIADALPQQKFTGKVISVAQKANSERTYPVEILVPNDTQESLKSGMFGRAFVQVAKAEKALVVPSSSVLTDPSGSYVFIEESGVAKRVPVQVGIQQNDQTQIVSGPEAGAKLVVSGQQRLSEGSKLIVEN